MMECSKIPLHVRVLGYREDGDWVALALEMGLRGYGKTFEEALKELEEFIEMQVSFALYKEDFDYLDHPAEKKYFKMYYNALLRKTLAASKGEKANSIDQEETTTLTQLDLAAQKKGDGSLMSESEIMKGVEQ